MSQKPIALDPDLQHLQQEGYEVEVKNGHLLVHSIPYVNTQRRVLRGILVTNLAGNVGKLDPPSDHQVWFVGEYPCHHNGQPIEGIRNSSGSFPLWSEFVAQHRFSNKPQGIAKYPDYYSKMKNYISIISHEAQAIEPDATPRTFKVIVPNEEDSVFNYWDTATSRANIVSISEKLSIGKVAIIGLGGTGSYVLDLVAKTSVREIHLFDGDTFQQHNAFRAPGAVSISTLEEKLPKVVYFTRVYSAMRKGIFPHDGYLDEANIHELAGFNFVFICVDRGGVRKLVSGYLREKTIPFVDVGMDLRMVETANSLFGTCRVTLSTPEKSDHFEKYAPQGVSDEGDLYQTNIQVADMNAFNAALAVFKWKQLCGFYQDLAKVHHTTFSINSHSLTRDEGREP